MEKKCEICGEFSQEFENIDINGAKICCCDCCLIALGDFLKSDVCRRLFINHRHNLNKFLGAFD